MVQPTHAGAAATPAAPVPEALPLPASPLATANDVVTREAHATARLLDAIHTKYAGAVFMQGGSRQRVRVTLAEVWIPDGENWLRCKVEPATLPSRPEAPVSEGLAALADGRDAP